MYVSCTMLTFPLTVFSKRYHYDEEEKKLHFTDDLKLQVSNYAKTNGNIAAALKFNVVESFVRLREKGRIWNKLHYSVN